MADLTHWSVKFGHFVPI